MFETVQGLQRLLNAKASQIVFPAMNNSAPTAQTTTVTSSTTLTNASGFSMLLGKGVYLVQGCLSLTAGASGGAKLALNTSDQLAISNMQIATKLYTGTTLSASASQTALGTSVVGATAAVTDATLDGTLTVTTPGTVTLQVAQNASNATSTTLNPGSFLQLTKIA